MELALIALLLGPPADPVVPALPSPGDYALVWHAPTECPDAAAIRARVLELRPDAASGADVAEIDGTVTGNATDGYELVLTTRFAEREHERRMSTHACDELGESTAIVIAVALREGLDAAMATVPTEPEVVPEAAVATEPHDTLAAAPPEPTLAPVQRSARPRPEPRLRIAGLGEIGMLGAVTGGVELGLGLAWPHARVELGGRYLAPRVRTDPEARVDASFQGGTASARGCWVPTLRRLELPLCGSFELGAVRVAPSFASRRVHTEPWGGPGVGLALARPIGPVRIWFGADLVVRVVGSTFRIENRPVFAQLPVSFRWLLGVEFRLSRDPSRKRPAVPDTQESRRAR